MSDPRIEAVKAAAIEVKQSGVHGEDAAAVLFLAMLDAARASEDEQDAEDTADPQPETVYVPVTEPEPVVVDPSHAEPAPAAEENKTTDAGEEE